MQGDFCTGSGDVWLVQGEFCLAMAPSVCSVADLSSLTGTAARPSGPSGALRRGGTCGAVSRLAWPCYRPRAPQPGPSSSVALDVSEAWCAGLLSASS